MSTKSKLALFSATLVTLFSSSAFAQAVNSPATNKEDVFRYAAGGAGFAIAIAALGGTLAQGRATAAARPAKGAKAKAHFEKVDILEEKLDKKGGGFYRVGDGEWLRTRDVRRPAVSAPPASLHPNERWIDVDLASQTLVAFEGDRPVFATLVSTGKGKEGTDTATPRGESRIWVKLTSSNMDNLEDEEAQRYYAIEDVPYVQYFAKGVGLHGAFWHRGFGKVRSHERRE